MPIYVVDAFSAEAFGGNPAAVCLLDAPRTDAQLQAIAAEMRHSETAFVLMGEGPALNLRWFTPVCEADLCGHATLAAAHVLWSERHVVDETITFATRSGELRCVRSAADIRITLPARPVSPAPWPLPDVSLEQAIGCAGGEYVGAAADHLILLPATAALRAACPDLAVLRRLGGRCVILTAQGDGAPYAFEQRAFAPNVGIDEDPVTGSAFATTGPFWAGRQASGAASFTCEAYQCSPRGGRTQLEVSRESVTLTARATTVLRGILGDAHLPSS